MRYCWIDYAKVMALFLVVMGHLPTDTGTCHKLIYNFHMPFFFFLSGLLHKEKSINSDVKRLLIPYLSLNVLMLILESPWIYRKEHSFGFIGETLSGIVYPLNMPISYPTWFLLSLFEIKLLVRLAQTVYAKTAMAIGCVVLAAFVISDDWELPFFLAATINAMPYYIIGIATKGFFLTDIRNRHRNALAGSVLMGGVFY
ncbi:MAG: acyltransferase family protein [Prevotellaceae bacterium]|nr:acyltransferase family protein [Prevotellaceae bacterium]